MKRTTVLILAMAALSAAMAQDCPYKVRVTGSMAPEGVELSTDGTGVWSGILNLDKDIDGEYLRHNIYFEVNDSIGLYRKRGGKYLSTQGERIRINKGCYTVRVNLNDSSFTIEAAEDYNRISVFGSSVANGQGAPGFHGYAYKYGELLQQRRAKGISTNGHYISGVSIGGNTTRHLLERYDDMMRDHGHYVVFGLSLGNEGIHGAADQEQVFAQFRDNMLSLIDSVKQAGKEPVIVNNYTRGDYDLSDYEKVRRMNLLIHQWDLPSVNVLGAIDDGYGRWAEGYIKDVAHPNEPGHEEFMYAIVPSLFDALSAGKGQPERHSRSSLTLGNGTYLQFQGEETVHPFTISMRVRRSGDGKLLQYVDKEESRAGELRANPDGSLTYRSTAGEEVTTEPVMSGDDWHDIMLSHYHAQGKSYLYVDGKLCGTASERTSLGKVCIGKDTASLPISEVAFWRSGMNGDEARAWHEGSMLKSSLEIYTPMDVNSDGGLDNLAQSLNRIEYKRL